MRIIGIDPGTCTTGYGIVDRRGSSTFHVDNGCIRPKGGLALSGRLQIIYDELKKLLEDYRPDVVAIESLFVAKNARSSLLLGHARGAAMLAASSAGIEIAEYTPATVKLSVVGNGRATKEQIQKMVRVILGLSEPAAEDASDALAVAICHCNSLKLNNMIKQAVTRKSVARRS